MAHKTVRLMLLGSPPDMVHGALSHRTRTPHDQIKALSLTDILYYKISVISRGFYKKFCYIRDFLKFEKNSLKASPHSSCINPPSTSGR